MVYCVTCQEKQKAQQNAYFKTDHGKAKRKIQNDRPEAKVAKAAYRASKEGIVKTKAYTNSDEYRAKTNAFAKTSAGKAIRKRTYSKNKLATDLMNGFARMIRGGDSPSTIKAISLLVQAQHAAHALDGQQGEANQAATGGGGQGSQGAMAQGVGGGGAHSIAGSSASRARTVSTFLEESQRGMLASLCLQRSG